MQAVAERRVQAYAVAVILTALLTVVKMLITPLGAASPFLTYFTAVLLSAWIGGVWPGLLATVLSAVCANLYFLPPYGHPALTGPHLLQSAVFLMEGVIATYLTASRASALRERDARMTREQTTRAVAEAAERRSNFLAEAGAILASSLDYAETLRSVAELAVPYMADWCAVHIVEQDGSVRTLITTHSDPAKVAVAESLGARIRFDPDAPHGVPAVIRTGKPELLPHIPRELIESGSDPEIVAAMRDLGLRSSMIVPLVAQGNVLGAITFVAAESNRSYGQEDLQTGVALAARAGLAVENARLFQRVERAAAERAAILENLTDAVIVVDASAAIQFMNPSARRLFGVGDELAMEIHSVDDLRRYLDASTPGNVLRHVELGAIEQALHGDAVHNLEVRVRTADGRERVLISSGAPIWDANGRLGGAVAAFRDVTAERDLDRQKSDFLSAVAHDLKNPLAVVRGSVQLLQRRAAQHPSPDMQRMSAGLERIDSSVGRMNRLLNELLDSTRLEMGMALQLHRSEFDLVAMVHAMIEEARAGSDRHTIVYDAPEHPVVGEWDPDRIERVLSNLLFNALKYSPSGGTVRVTVSVEEERTERWTLISVQDEGIGIPPGDMERIFERFYRAGNVDPRTPGTGIGLAAVQTILAEHGGTVTARSSEGRGSTFTVRLPRVLTPQTGG